VRLQVLTAAFTVTLMMEAVGTFEMSVYSSESTGAIPQNALIFSVVCSPKLKGVGLEANT
jgi:hypothetical protein